MKKLRVLDLFSGIGGFSLGLERTGGFETVAFCEIEDFPRRVLAKHWPEVPIYDDVRTLTADILERNGISVDVITGGFPCQDISVAGKQAGIADGTRSGLWSEIVRLTRELRPRYVIVENVANLLSGPSSKRGGWFGRVLGDLAECGYDAEWENIPASAVGASHRRERVWLMAYAEKLHSNGGEDNSTKRMGREPLSKFGNGGWSRFMADPDQIRRPEMGIQHHSTDCGKAICGQSTDHVGSCGGYSRAGWWLPEPNVGRVANGVSRRVDRLAALGNAVVPQIPEMIGYAILEAERNMA